MNKSQLQFLSLWVEALIIGMVGLILYQGGWSSVFAIGFTIAVYSLYYGVRGVIRYVF